MVTNAQAHLFSRAQSASARIRKLLARQSSTATHVVLVAVPVGMLVGLGVSLYDYVINTLLWDHFTSHMNYNFLVLLPVVGMTIAGIIMRGFRVPTPAMADEIVRAYLKPDEGLPYRSALPKLFASIATIGFGASAGMEGASKWVGGVLSGGIQKQLNRRPWLKPFHGKVETTLLAGAAAGIGAIFRAPLTGAIMGIESPYKHDLAHEALVHGLVASAMSYATFAVLRTSTPYFPLHWSYTINFRDLAFCLPLGLAAGLLSHGFLGLLQGIKARWAKWQAPLVFKYFVGGLLVSAVGGLALWTTGYPATLQAGTHVANDLLNGRYALTACLLILVLKILATALTFGTGGVGGLFVPSATIGAALGAVFDVTCHPSQPGVFTLVGMAAFTGASYNSLLFAAVFVAEATGSPTLVVPGLLASSMAFLVAAGVSNSQSQKAHRDGDPDKLADQRCDQWMESASSALPSSLPLEQLPIFAGSVAGMRGWPVVLPSGKLGGILANNVAERRLSLTKEATVSDVLLEPVIILTPNTSLEVAEQALSDPNLDGIPVVEELSKQLLGIVTTHDILRARSQLSRKA